MSLTNLVNIIKNDPYDVTYIGIGSALLRPDEEKDRQQFPPFIEKLLFSSNFTIRLINIDSKFENPLFLKSYIKNQQIISDIESKTDRLSIVYLEETLSYDKIYNKDVDVRDLDILDEINKVIIQQNNLLIVGNYTGVEVSKFERYFSNLYKNTDYEIGFNKYITYDFTNDGNGYCCCNLIKNFPIIDNKEIIKLSSSPSDLLHQYLNNINNNKVLLKLKKFCESNLINYISTNQYIYRNIKSNNISQFVKSHINDSIFNNTNFDDIIHTYKSDLNNIKSYLVLNYEFTNDELNELSYLINNVDTLDSYEWFPKIKQLLTKIIIIGNKI